MKKLLIIIALAVASLSTQAQISSVYTHQFQHVLDSVGAKWRIKGLSAAILIPNEGVWTGTYGESHAGTPLTTDMYLPIGSNTKTFTAAIILKLHEQGLLNINDPISNWITDPNVNGAVTVKQLLNHRSGLYDYTMNSNFFAAMNADYKKIWKAEEMLQFLEPPVNAPDAVGEYCNTNYLLLGLIIKAVTGKEIHTAFHDMIMIPQGLNETVFYPQVQPQGIIPHGWAVETSTSPLFDMMADWGYENTAFLSMASAAGAIVSTPEDNVKFWNKLMTGQIVSNASLDMMKDAKPIDRGMVYGLGLDKSGANGRITYGHGGTCFGFINENLWDSKTGVCITVFSNQDSVNNTGLFELVVKNLHKITTKMPPTTVQEIAYDNQVKLYPNPASKMVQLDAGNVTGSYELRDVTGKLIANGEVSQGINTLSLAGISSGMYIVRVSDKGSPVFTGKLQVN